METIGTKISKIRKQKGMSQESLSDLSKINLRTLQRIEKDENEPRGNTLKQICEALKTPIEELVDYGKTEDLLYLFSFVNTLIFGISMYYAFTSHKPESLFIIYFSLILLNIIYALFCAISVLKRKIRLFYPNPIKFVK